MCNIIFSRYSNKCTYSRQLSAAYSCGITSFRLTREWIENRLCMSDYYNICILIFDFSDFFDIYNTLWGAVVLWASVVLWAYLSCLSLPMASREQGSNPSGGYKFKKLKNYHV